MNEQKRKRILRVGCLILAGVFLLSVLGSVILMLWSELGEDTE